MSVGPTWTFRGSAWVGLEAPPARFSKCLHAPTGPTRKPPLLQCRRPRAVASDWAHSRHALEVVLICT